MELEDLIDAKLAGDTPLPSDELPSGWQPALAAHEALVNALGETLIWLGEDRIARSPPDLPKDYEIVREIGAGGMGVVYLAKQQSLGREIAVKVLRPGERAFGPLVQRFLDEARHLARLRHPHIVPVHEVGSAGDEPYFTMDYIEGCSLSELLEKGPLSPSRAVSIFKQIASALAHAHAQGIIHRDLKPANVLIAKSEAHSLAGTSEHVFVSDFGLARDLSHDSKLTGSGAILGTPAYMAPEQARGQSELIGEATDVHALGVLLYEMLTGTAPYGRDAVADVFVRLLGQEPAPPRKLDRRIPRDLETICLKAMAKRPEARYASVQAMLSDIERWERGEPIFARRANVFDRTLKFLHRQWKAVLSASVTVVLCFLLAPWLFDKSVDVLIQWGLEERAEGNHAEAIRLFHRAAKLAKGKQRWRTLEFMLQTAQESEDTKGLIEAALMLAEDHPERSFGEYDWLIAQAAVGKVRACNPNQAIRWTPEECDPLLRLAAERLNVFLKGDRGTREERRQAQFLLEEVLAELDDEPVQLDAVDPEEMPKLPDGTPEELLVKAADEREVPWQRGLAGLSAAHKLETLGDKKAAFDAYRLALEQMQKVYPFYEGVGNVYTQVLNDRSVARLNRSYECGLVKETAEALMRLESHTPSLLKGGIRLKVSGVRIPSNVQQTLQVFLWSPDSERGDRRLYPAKNSFSLPEVPVGPDQTAWVGVVPGRYKLEISSAGRSLTGQENREIYRRVILDFDKLPKEIEIGSEVVELTIPARLMDDITLKSPQAGEAVNLARDSFRWSSVPGAARYEVLFNWVTLDADGGTTMHTGQRLSSTEPRLDPHHFHSASDWFRKNLKVGQTATWSVEAYDANTRQIGRSTEDQRPFLVAGELPESPKKP